jgi:hypothetical protein
LKEAGQKANSDNIFTWHFCSMHRRVYRNPAVQTILILASLDKSTRSTDDSDRWKSYFIGITKQTFSSVVNLKRGIAHRAPGFTLHGFDTLVQAKWAC